MIDRDHGQSLGRQAKALGISRGIVYCLPRLISNGDLKLMRLTDDSYLEFPFSGRRILKGFFESGRS